MKPLNFGWGDTLGIRLIFAEIFGEDYIKKGFTKASSLSYPPIYGIPEVQEQFKKLTKDLTGISYKYIIITSGCTQAVGASIKCIGKNLPATFRTPYYLMYPHLIESVGVNFVKPESQVPKNIIIDSPSNPEGLLGIRGIQINDEDRVTWDGAYHSPTYGVKKGTSDIILSNISEVFCGSFSKLTGLNGVRIGWVATNNFFVYDKISNYVRNNICGVSPLLQHIAKCVIENEDKMDSFYVASRKLIESNKEETMKLDKIFGGIRHAKYGMYLWTEVDKTLLNYFKANKITVVDGAEFGKEGYIRLNMALPIETTVEMVRRIIKHDRKGKV